LDSTPTPPPPLPRRYIEQIYAYGDFLVGGQIECLNRIRWNDGLDEFRKTPSELKDEFKKLGADTVYAFQLRNPVHNGTTATATLGLTILSIALKSPHTRRMLLFSLVPICVWDADRSLRSDAVPNFCRQATRS